METIVDDRGRPIKVGGQVRVSPAPEDEGIVQSISDLDGDAGPYGEPIAINPNVTVLFGDGETDSFSTSNSWASPDVYVCDDLEATT